MQRILLIDATNNFLRNFAAISIANANGEPVGGICGFVTNIMYWVEQMRPNKVYVCWDGVDGGFKRKKILKEYKQNRKSLSHVNRNIEYTQDEIDKNKNYQITTLKKILDTIPIIQLEYDYTEADDIISILCALNKDKQKIIISSDKDFYQLLDNNTICFNPIKKCYINLVNVQQKYGVNTENFALYKSLIGDKSDNVKGVVGIGPKHVMTLFPFLSLNHKYTIQEILCYCNEQINDDNCKHKKLYQKVIDQQELLIKCYNVVQLTDSIVPGSRIQIIKQDMQKNVVMESIALRILASEDLQCVDIEKFILTLNGLLASNRKGLEIYE